MVAMNLKVEAMTLMDKRAAVETEMNSIIESLCSPGGPGISGNLVDSEGFPREGIDIPAVRAQRRRLAELRNDHKDITDKIDKNLQLLHRLSKYASGPPTCSGTSTSINDSSTQYSPMEEDPIVGLPFAMIDEIAEDSPAAEDGLQLGDEIIKFGNVETGDGLQARLVNEAQSNQGRPVSLVIMRQGCSIILTVTPRQWRGRGLLGCHFRML
ncbi:uncharacterized protein [Typha latifolia]|uniref:uncharacterized protein n=1 Tax=Typha latifolia TaxID=4733 RepID=UPI003C2ADAC8